MAGLIIDRRHLIATLPAPFIATAIRDSGGPRDEAAEARL
jgi:hypothetical protein